MLAALLWDVDGTLAATERDGHLIAFNRAFAELGVPWRWSEAEYGELLRVAGGYERLLHDMAGRAAAPPLASSRAALARQVHELKNRIYGEIVRSGELPLRPGVAELLADCERAQLALGIVTTTSAANVRALLDSRLGAGWRTRFATLVCAEQAPRKKPDSQAYRLALETLRLTPQQAVAVEDSPAGVAAASAAGIATLVTPSHYFPASGAGGGVLASGPSLASPSGWRPAAQAAATRITLGQIEHWAAAQPRP